MCLGENLELEIAKILLANILAFSETEEGKKMFQSFKEQKEQDSSDTEDDDR